MRRHLVAAAGLMALAPTAALADAPSPKLKREYQKAYAKAKKHDADPGRNIVAHGVAKPGRDRPAHEGEVRRSIRILDRMAPATVTGSVASPTLQAIAACESGGDPTAVDASGTYRGKYQFDYGTWASVGGTGDPAAAPEAEQDRRAQLLLSRSGTSPWPVCGA
jgi:hypothetical protein